MAIDTPATIVVLGGGPIGIEAAIYARYLGYDVILLEQADILAENVRVRGHLRLFNSFKHNHSTLGLAALRAQDRNCCPPDPNQRLTGLQWIQHYLIPLSETDLLAGHIRTHHRVLAIEPTDAASADPVSEQQGNKAPSGQFQVLVQSQSAEPSIITTDAVIDATGVLNHPVMCGPNGSPAEGESAITSKLEYSIPDVLGVHKTHYVRRHTLVIGNGLSAALTVTALAQLAQDEPGTRVHWLIGPIPDPIPWWLTTSDSTRVFRPWLEVLERAEQQTKNAAPSFVRDTERTIRAFASDSRTDGVRVWFDNQPKPECYDRVIVNRGHRSDFSLYQTLQTGQGTDARLSIERMTNPEGRPDLQQQADIPAWSDTFLSFAPNLYVIGAKSFSHAGGFPFLIGLHQIVGMFAEIGGRAELDLYATFRGTDDA